MATETSRKFRRLLQPGQLGGIELRNRIVMTAAGTNMTEQGTVTDRQIAYFEERAKGGAGLIITSPCVVGRLGGASERSWSLADDRLVVRFRELTKAIRRHGAVVGVQMLHAGSSAAASLPGDVRPVSASEFPVASAKKITRALSQTEIQEVEQEYAMAAVRARDAGAQLVELNCSSGYLIREFLSPRTNKRSDKYGGAIENRVRFLVEVIGAIRQAAGADLPVICRLTGDEFLEGGSQLEDAVAIARAAEAAGVSGINVTVGGHETGIPLTPGIVPPAAYAYYAQQIRRATRVPVIYATRVSTPEVAEAILRDGQADFVGMLRALLADPFLPTKLAESRRDEIIPCVACHQGCYDQQFSGKAIFCLANPRTAYERERDIRAAEQQKRVLVVGGGGAGMQTAIVAARRGHHVTLVERAEELGGQFKVLSATPGKRDFLSLLEYMKSELKRTGVEVLLNREADASFVTESRADTVIVATGSVPAKLPVPGADLPHVFTAHDVLNGETELGDRVVVIGGNAVGIETALFAARKGAITPEAAVYLAGTGAWDARVAIDRVWRARDVTVLEMLPRSGADLGRTTRWSTMMAVRKAGITIITEAKVVAIEPDAVVYEKDGELLRVPSDTVVVAVGARANGSLAEELRARGVDVHVVGDAVQPRKLLDAIREGFLVASAV